MEEVTGLSDLLIGANNGDQEAVNQLFATLYDDLRRLAHSRMRGADPPTMLGTTVLVHESYMRMVRSGRIQLKDRGRFLAYAARVMRSIVVDLVRERAAQRAGGDAIQVTLSEDIAKYASPAEVEILHVHKGLEKLAELSPRLAQAVEMRYFAGMSEIEIAEALGVTERTVRRDWEKARMILAATLK